MKWLRGEQEAAAAQQESIEDETRRKLVLNFPVMTMVFLEPTRDLHELSQSVDSSDDEEDEEQKVEDVKQSTPQT